MKVARGAMPSLRRMLPGFALGVASSLLVVTTLLWFRCSASNPGPRLYQDFSSGRSSGLASAQTGQPWVKASNGVEGAPLEIRDGLLTNTASSNGPAAGYLSADLGVPVTSMSGTFQFAQGSTLDGSAAFAVFMDMLPTTPIGRSTFTSPCHLVVTPMKFDFGVANEGIVTVVRTQDFSEPLEFGRPYKVGIELDYQHSLARINGPDGHAYVVSDPRISINRASVATFEVYQQTAKTDDRASFRTVAAS
jgi:hypothetical protein